MKSLQQGINEYLEYRYKLGFKLKSVKSTLISFSSFMEKNCAKHITANLAIKFATMNPKVTPATWATRLGIIRRFAVYWSAIDPKTKITPKNLLSHSYQRRCPYIYTDEEIKKILTCHESDFCNIPFEQHLYFVLFGLLAVTGMRISEALSLDCDDVDLQNGILTGAATLGRNTFWLKIMLGGVCVFF